MGTVGPQGPRGYSCTVADNCDGTATVACEDGSSFSWTHAPPRALQVAAGYYTTCALKTDGAVACWGYNGYGQATPPDEAFTQVAAGLYHTCGLSTQSSVACWGLNNRGQASPPPFFQ